MATVATRPGEIHVPHCANRIDLTPTGLLMEGVNARVRFSFALFGVAEWNGIFQQMSVLRRACLAGPN